MGGAFAELQTLSLVGDLDGDGYRDAVGLVAGRSAVRVYHGGADGLSRTAVATLEAPKKTRTFAAAFAGVGDVNGDGYGDLVVGAPGVLEAYVYFGAPPGATPAAPLTLSKASCHEHSSFGVTVGAAGDVDGDGFADFVVTASGNNYLYLFRGGAPRPASESALALFGGGDTQWASAMRGAGDVDGDGSADLSRSCTCSPADAAARRTRPSRSSCAGPLAPSTPSATSTATATPISSCSSSAPTAAARVRSCFSAAPRASHASHCRSARPRSSVRLLANAENQEDSPAEGDPEPAEHEQGACFAAFGPFRRWRRARSAEDVEAIWFDSRDDQP
jgi:hypothetical protein